MGQKRTRTCNVTAGQICFSDTRTDSEARRLEALQRLDILDTPREEPFDRITRLISRIFSVEVGIVSVIDAHRQWYKASTGLPNDEVAREDTFCRHVIATGTPLVVENAAADARFRENPYVRAPHGIRFYAGMPLTAELGEHVGSICAIDFKPRVWSTQHNEILAELAALAMDYIQLRYLVATDGLTGLFTRRAFMEEGQRAMALAVRKQMPLACIAFDIDHFKAINDKYGHAAGDRVLREVATACMAVLRQSDVIGRIGGEEFAVLLPHTGLADAMEAAEKLRRASAFLRINIDGASLQITASFGVSVGGRHENDVESLLAAADRAMYRSKEGRNRCTAAQSEAPRRRVLKAGRIVFNGRSSTIDCTVRSLGEDGAGLDVTNTSGIPDRFVLTLTADQIEKPCRTVARTARHLEVEFA